MNYNECNSIWVGHGELWAEPYKTSVKSVRESERSPGGKSVGLAVSLRGTPDRPMQTITDHARGQWLSNKCREFALRLFLEFDVRPLTDSLSGLPR